MTAPLFRDEVPDPTLIVYAPIVGPTFFLNNNARPNRAVSVEDHLEYERIARIECAVYSPNLNITEHLWKTLGLASCSTPSHSHRATNYTVNKSV